MRDQTRIKPFLEKVEKLWNNYPDLRFWQVVLLMLEQTKDTRYDPFYWEEDNWEQCIDALIKDKDGENTK